METLKGTVEKIKVIIKSIPIEKVGIALKTPKYTEKSIAHNIIIICDEISR